jgi:pyruvate dehydrogenase phosphatase
MFVSDPNNSDPIALQQMWSLGGFFGPELRFWQFAGVFEGHRALRTSQTLAHRLLFYLLEHLEKFYMEYNDGFEFDTISADGTRWRDPPSDQIDDAVKTAFRATDRFYVHHLVDEALSSESAAPRGLAFDNLMHALSGSTALISFYDNQTRQLRIACTGTSRALLGRRAKDARGDTIYEVHVLSEDQTPENPKEVARIRSEHPGESLFKDGRYFGLRTTRAFGHAHLKLPHEDMERMRRFDGPTADEHLPANVLKTPPYLTVEPVIVTTDVQPGDFLIMATEGLWQWLTNAEAVGLVGMWLDEPLASKSGYDDPIARDALPVRIDEDKTPRWKRWGTQKRFVNVDGNAATHLLRNALGAANIDTASALLSLEPPWAQQY